MGLQLPYGNLDSGLRGLAGQAEGFGRSAVGGLNGDVYFVTTLADDGPGSLRYGCRKKEPLWIIFQVSGTIELSSYLSVSSYKTIDGRGQIIKLTGQGLRLKECEHVIICNLILENGVGDDADAIQIKPNSRHIWIDRCSLSNFCDGLIDISRSSTDITISRLPLHSYSSSILGNLSCVELLSFIFFRCYFTEHNKTVLIGADPSHIDDRCMRVTIHHCFFDGTRQRHPRVRFAKVHLYNNYTRNWAIYAVCASVESQIYSECNIYEAGEKKIAFKYYKETAGDKEEACSGNIKSKSDTFVGATEAGLMGLPSESCVFDPSEYYDKWTVEAPTDDLKYFLQRCTGWQHVCLPS